MENKIKKLYICMGIMLIMVFGCITVSAATLINSRDVVYDNTASGLRSTTVQGAVDELYSAATDYSTLSNKVNSLKAEIIDAIYPKGSIYMSTEDDTVAKVEAKFGGTWERYSEGRTLIGVGTGTDSNGTAKVFNKNESSGEYSHTLTMEEIPSHTHSIPSLSVASSGAHTHTTTQKNTTTMSLTAGSAGSHTHPVSTAGYNITIAVGTSSQGCNTNSVAWPNPVITASGCNSSVATSAGAHTHSVTGSVTIPELSISSSGAHTHTTTASTTGAAGSSAVTGFSMLEPYTTVYMYKRIN